MIDATHWGVGLVALRWSLVVGGGRVVGLIVVVSGNQGQGACKGEDSLTKDFFYFLLTDLNCQAII